ncbi:O-antigen ligase family protein [Mucilaginibacter sp.]|uniref:O-antigen ligase family protein n=1 Tax=Mucilaginibacter sp. TaxID=1882438 RepID=UPI0026365A40|nr:O-antigen ligase family protein [Mucilaginibacter sp.]MDB5129229.1 hypothetical protein [Mucilaginibacter sp.]
MKEKLFFFVLYIYRVIQHWRVPIFEKIAQVDNVDFKILHGPDFKDTKVVNSTGEISFKSKKNIILKYSKLSSGFLYTTIFLTFIGSFIILLILSNIGLTSLSRFFTIPVRLLIVLGLGVGFILNPKTKNRYSINLMIWFSLLYLFRIAMDFIQNNRYGISYQEVFLYFLSFGCLPFIFATRIRLNAHCLKIIFNAILLSSFVFALLAATVYKQFIGSSIGRVTIDAAGKEVLSPLILSYCGALAIGVIVSFLFENASSLSLKTFCILTIALSLIPFFLGASRGSLIALYVPFLMIMISKKRSVFANVKIIVLILLSMVILFYLAQLFGSNLFERLSNTDKDISQGNSSAIRTVIWKQSWAQFTEHPIAGDKFQVVGFAFYPHNIIIEALQTTGILGTLPLLLLIIKGLTASFKVLKFEQRYSWVVVIFIQSLVQNMFSGALYKAGWFWFSLALVITLNISIERKRKAIGVTLVNGSYKTILNKA